MRSHDFVQGAPVTGMLARSVGPADTLRIVQVAPPYFDVPPIGYGGVDAVVADLADTLVARGREVIVLGGGKPGAAARFVPPWIARFRIGLTEPYPEVMHALKVRSAIARIAATDGVTSSTTTPSPVCLTHPLTVGWACPW